LIFFNQKDRRD